MTSIVVLAVTGEGHEVAAVYETPMSAESVRRLAAVAAMPGLARPETTWTTKEGTTSR